MQQQTRLAIKGIGRTVPSADDIAKEAVEDLARYPNNQDRLSVEKKFSKKYGISDIIVRWEILQAIDKLIAADPRFKKKEQPQPVASAPLATGAPPTKKRGLLLEVERRIEDARLQNYEASLTTPPTPASEPPPPRTDKPAQLDLNLG
ncbi:MAG TPA: hypothetical protein VGE35_03675 [Candidatus Paceibacterota bacterium]